MRRAAIALWAAVLPALAAAGGKIVLVAGKPSHGPGAHEFNAGVLLMQQCLRQNKGADPVIVKGGWPEDESVFEGARAVVLFLDGGVSKTVHLPPDVSAPRIVELIQRARALGCKGVAFWRSAGGPAPCIRCTL